MWFLYVTSHVRGLPCLALPPLIGERQRQSVGSLPKARFRQIGGKEAKRCHYQGIFPYSLPNHPEPLSSLYLRKVEAR